MKKKRQPPVSLHPLQPEEALAGLMQVKPEREEDMPKFASGDLVRVKLEAKLAPEEVRGQEGTVMSLDPSQYGRPDNTDTGISYQVFFLQLGGRTERIFEAELDPL